MITLDFETEGIVGNPLIDPPKPVGLAVKHDDSPSYYVTGEAMRTEWLSAINSDQLVAFQNAPFDLSVGAKAFGSDMPDWTRIHDSQYVIYLADPYAKSLSLKPAAADLLGWPADEQDKVKEWVLANIPKVKKREWGAHICKAPVEIVAPYACGDVDRTYAFVTSLRDELNMEEAYDRERRLMPILVEGTQRGIRLDRPRLERDIDLYEQAMEEVSKRIYDRIGLGSFQITSDQTLADMLERSGKVTEFRLTAKGARSVSKPNLLETCHDKELLDMLFYRSSLDTCLGTFMRPWLELSARDGRVHPNWNQVRGDRPGGTRTGRLSSDSPNFQNVPNEFDHGIPEGLPPLPRIRVYCLPEEGHRWVKRDFSSQEVRILAHFEDGELMEAYCRDPNLDPHEMVKQIVLAITGKDFKRKAIKVTVFTIIYGGGPTVTAGRLRCALSEAKELHNAVYTALPGIRVLQNACTGRGRRGDAIKTWGGRLYYKEPHPRFDFSYKLLNYLIQGSAADQTKQVICDWYDNKHLDTLFLATVHDEINLSVPENLAPVELAVLEHHMNQELFDVPMRSEGFMGPNWEQLETYV